MLCHAVTDHEHDGMFGCVFESALVEFFECGAADMLCGRTDAGDNGDMAVPVVSRVCDDGGEQGLEVGVGHEDEEHVGIWDFAIGQGFPLPRGAGENSKRTGMGPVCERDPCATCRPLYAANTGDNTVGNSCFFQGFHFFAHTPKDHGVATFESDHTGSR